VVSGDVHHGHATSAISYISIPAFVALKDGGGLTWLRYELAVLLAIILVMAFLIPFFRKLKLVSVYEYLQWRYAPSVRSLVGLVFLISRGLSTGVGMYASGIVLSVWLGIPLWLTIVIIGVVTVIYDTIGGIFLYTSYYGTDQSQVQHELSAATTADTKKIVAAQRYCPLSTDGSLCCAWGRDAGRLPEFPCFAFSGAL